MWITMNGTPNEVADGIRLDALLASCGYGDRRVAVEINEEIVPRSRHAERVVAAGDRIEIVQAIGGG
jgi:sulfur carrier protein